MLPVPNLDDRTFKQIVEDSRKMISRFIPDWTDENYHDPGITFIELFAWLSEMQNYYLNRITVKNELKFLKLLGVCPKEQASAKADVTFSNVPGSFLLPRGTGVSAGEQHFETDEAILLTPIKIEKLISYIDGAFTDYSSINESEVTTFFPFGKEIKSGSGLYIGFDNKFDVMSEISLTFDLYEDYPIGYSKIDGSEKEFIPPAIVNWEYYTYDKQSGEYVWSPLKVERDGTYNMCFSGKLTFKVSSQMSLYKLNPEQNRERYWLRGVLKETGYENPPRIRTIKNNTVLAVQRQTLVEYRNFSASGEAVQIIEAEGYLPYYGACEVQVKDKEGYWIYWHVTEDLTKASPKDCCCMIKKNSVDKTAVIMFGDGKCGKIPEKGEGNIRIISCLPSFMQYKLLAAGTGLSNQVVKVGGIKNECDIFKKSFVIQAGVWSKDINDFKWEDWHHVEDFDSSGNSDRHFIIDTQSRKVTFGNNENGIAPEKSDNINIRIISLRVGGGENGNVKENEINNIASETDEHIKVSNHLAAVGGREKETVDDAKRNIRRDMKRQYRAVTCEDYEEIVRNTPGLRVARVKALPLYEKGLKNYPNSTVPAKVTVVVLPYSDTQNPIPSKGFLDTVKNHLDKFRLITTEIDVIPPEYIKITVHGTVVVAPHIKPDPRKIEDVLYKLLDPINRSDVSKGWEFGRTIYKGDIYSEISKIAGVEYIKDIWINAEGEGIRKDMSGDIYIPPYGLVYSGEHEIEIASKMDT
jgi:hypothetical protein